MKISTEKIVVEIEIHEEKKFNRHDETATNRRVVYNVSHVDGYTGDRVSPMGLQGANAAGALFAVAKIIQAVNAPFEYKPKEQ